jgi:hypothetical protein
MGPSWAYQRPRETERSERFESHSKDRHISDVRNQVDALQQAGRPPRLSLSVVFLPSVDDVAEVESACSHDAFGVPQRAAHDSLAPRA